MSRTPRIVLAALAAALVAVVPAGSSLVAPVLTGPDSGTTVDALPPFKWEPVEGAASYSFEFSGDPAFNSTHAVITTKNTRATLKTLFPNGTYYWRVRALAGSGALGDWSEVRELEMEWAANPSLQAPADGATISYPAEALELKWGVVPGASKYFVRVATDPELGSLLWDGDPIETAATQFTLSKPLAAGTYYWGIVPLDADGHEGEPSAVRSFVWEWPSETDPDVADLVGDPEVYDPQFSWDPVPGAAGYDVEINFSSDWTESSKVCCSPIKGQIDTLGTAFTPAATLQNNTYYWRVRAIDAGNNAGVWNEGPTFTKTFANVPPVTAPAVKNLRVRDNVADPASDTDGGTAVVDTDTPVLAWDPVPGASGYNVMVTAYAGGICDWSASSNRWDKFTTVTAWTPLGWSRMASDPYPSGVSISTDANTGLVAGTEYCVRVRALDRPADTADAGPAVSGDWAYLPANNQPAFRWNGPPATSACSPCTMAGSDYVGPLTGATLGFMPLFTWQPIAGAESYYVLVARDPNFTNVVDYAYTRIPAYAPREFSQSIGYADETTLYYWAVLPADNANGSGVSADPLTSGAQSFTKQSVPPLLESPVSSAVVATPATVFHWEPVGGAQNYRIQVSQTPTFSGAFLTNAVTDSTSFTSNKTYPADTALYWRVRAEAENGVSSVVALTWSATGTFTKQLPKPVLDPGNPTGGAFLPTVKWSPVDGAISYDLRLVEPDGDLRTFTGIPAAAAAFVKMTGVGIFTWQVRASFPTDTTNPTPGPYSLSGTFNHTLPEPASPAEETGVGRLLLSWNPRPRADEYRVQISTRADFLTTVESTTTQTTAYAPLLTSTVYTAGGTFYWRVAMIDADSNLGDYTGIRSFTLPAIPPPGGGDDPPVVQRFKVTSTGYPARRKTKTITLTVRNASFQPVAGASVRVSGAGVKIVTKRTGVTGKVSFRVRATRYPGKVTFRISKAGFTTLKHVKTVRPV